MFTSQSYDSSDDDYSGASAHFKSKSSSYRQTKSVGASVMKNAGSDTCTFEKMDDQTANKLLKHSSKKSETKNQLKGGAAQEMMSSTMTSQLQLVNLPNRVTFPMDNLGNTCFFNSVMQCLTHTSPFHTLCLSRYHEGQCKRQKKSCYQCNYASYIQALT